MHQPTMQPAPAVQVRTLRGRAAALAQAGTCVHQHAGRDVGAAGKLLQAHLQGPRGGLLAAEQRSERPPGTGSTKVCRCSCGVLRPARPGWGCRASCTSGPGSAPASAPFGGSALHGRRWRGQQAPKHPGACKTGSRRLTAWHTRLAGPDEHCCAAAQEVGSPAGGLQGLGPGLLPGAGRLAAALRAAGEACRLPALGGVTSLAAGCEEPERTSALSRLPAPGSCQAARHAVGVAHG